MAGRIYCSVCECGDRCDEAPLSCVMGGASQGGDFLRVRCSPGQIWKLECGDI